MSKPQTIQIYLPTGNAQETRVAEITTRTVQAFDIPRDQITKFFQQPESDQVAVYYLFGDETADGRTSCYIGQTSSSKSRFREHLKNADKEFWTRVVIVISRTNTLTDTHARYLEWKSIRAGYDAGRFALENKNNGSKPHTPAPLEAECEEIYDTIQVLLSTLGYPLFQQLSTQQPQPEDRIVHIHSRGAVAKGVYSSEGLTVYKGSTVATVPTNAATTDALKKQREQFKESGILVDDGNKLKFSRDYVFKSPSAAACMVLFRSANGWIEWKHQDGTKLNDLVGRELPEKEVV